MEMGKSEKIKKIAIIGGGHIGLALVEGFINSGRFTANQIIVANPSLSKITYLKKRGIKVTTDNELAIKQAYWVFIAVKPTIVRTVLKEISNAVKNKVIISLAAAVTIDMMQKEIHKSSSTIVRIMPNIPISCNHGVIGLFSNQISGIDKAQVMLLLETVGLVVEVEKESDLDTLTLISACGPAVVSFFMDMMLHVATKLGLTKNMANKLVEQTFSGTLTYLKKSAIPPVTLMASVATKGGMTETILQSLKEQNFYSRFTDSMNLGSIKLKKLSKDLQN